MRWRTNLNSATQSYQRLMHKIKREQLNIETAFRWNFWKPLSVPRCVKVTCSLKFMTLWFWHLISENKWFLQHLPLWLGTNEVVFAKRTFKKINQKGFSIRKNCHPIHKENNCNFQYRILLKLMFIK